MISNYIHEFRTAFSLPIGEPVTRARALLHDSLIREEAQEYSEAAKAGDHTEMLDALADIVYVAYGAAADFGWNLDEAIRIVHESNMSKLENGQPIYNEMGKVMKGRDYQPPKLNHLI